MSTSEHILAELAGLKEQLDAAVGERDVMRLELERWRNGPVDEEMLRKQDGSLRVGKGCEITIDGTNERLNTTIAQLTKARLLIAETGLTEDEGSTLGMVESICDLARQRNTALGDCVRLMGERDEARRELETVKADRERIREWGALLSGHASSDAALCERLRAAWNSVERYVITQMFGCRGDKCREPQCYSCNGEEEAMEEAAKARTTYDAMNALLVLTPSGALAPLVDALKVFAGFAKTFRDAKPIDHTPGLFCASTGPELLKNIRLIGVTIDDLERAEQALAAIGAQP